LRVGTGSADGGSSGAGRATPSGFLGGAPSPMEMSPSRRPRAARWFERCSFLLRQSTSSTTGNRPAFGARPVTTTRSPMSFFRSIGRYGPPPTSDRAWYWMPVVGVFASYVAAVPLGISRHAIDAFITLAAAKTPSSSDVAPGRQAGSAGQARAGARAGNGRPHEPDRHPRGALGEGPSGHRPTVADHRSLWVTATRAGQSALEAIEMLYASAGASSVYATCPLDRCLRDAYGRSAHGSAGGQLRAPRARTPVPRRSPGSVDHGLSRRRCVASPSRALSPTSCCSEAARAGGVCSTRGFDQPVGAYRTAARHQRMSDILGPTDTTAAGALWPRVGSPLAGSG
jgi:hypothetical protein